MDKRITKVLILMMLPFAVGGCVNGFEKYYQKAQVPEQFLKPPFVMPPPLTPSVYTYSSVPRADDHRLLQDGYLYLGRASFYANANRVSRAQAVEQGKKIGAAVVLIHSEYKDTISGSVPYTVQNPPVVSTVNTSGTVNVSGYGGGASGTYNSTGSIVTPGGSTTYEMPYSFDRNTFVATFWAKRANDKIVLGINVKPLPDELKRHLERNTGVIVDVVVRGTPAFQANVLEGDVLLKIAADDVLDVPSFLEIVPKYAGRTVTIQILRGDQPKVVSVALRPNP